MPGLKPGTEEQIIKGMYLLEDAAAAGRPAAGEPAGLGHHPARIDRRPPAAGGGLGRGRQGLELPQLQRTGARRPGLRALEPAAPDRDAARALRGPAAGRPCRPGDLLDRLHQGLRRADPRLHPQGHAPTRCWAPTASAAAIFRSKLREHFEVNRHYIVVAALKTLADEGKLPAGQGGRGDQEVRPERRQDQPAVRLTHHRTETRTWHWSTSRCRTSATSRMWQSSS